MGWQIQLRSLCITCAGRLLGRNALTGATLHCRTPPHVVVRAKRLHYCDPVFTFDRSCGLLLARAREALPETEKISALSASRTEKEFRRDYCTGSSIKEAYFVSISPPSRRTTIVCSK